MKTLLGAHPGWEAVGETVDGVEAVGKTRQLTPGVVLLDLSMPRMGGLEACRLIRNVPESEVLVATQHDSPQMMQAAGALGYVVKSNIARDLVKAVEATTEHRPFGQPCDLPGRIPVTVTPQGITQNKEGGGAE